jgi:phage terminase large subunit-like protein
MTVLGEQQGELYYAPPEFPPGVDGHALLEPCFHSAWRHAGPQGRAYRVAVTRGSPLLFAVTYLGHHLRDQTSGLMSFGPHHLDMARRARRWRERRAFLDADVLPRGGAKSTWKYLINPLWAMAHRHRTFPLFVSYNGEQAIDVQLGNLRAELRENDLLLYDFPELRPRKGSNTKRTVLTNGTSFAARGLFGTSLGIRLGSDRPDLIVGDDLEPGPERHNPEMKLKIEAALTSSILPMGARHTAVELAGTTTMVGSLMHDVVRSARGERVASWIAAHGFQCHYYPAILDEGTEQERSLWPQRWSLEWLRRLRAEAPQDYALNYANRPELEGARGWWRPELIRVEPRLSSYVQDRVLYVDPAMKNKKTSDQTAIVVAGLAYGRVAVIEHAEAGRWPGEEIRLKVWDQLRYNPSIKTVIVEDNQGGDRNLDLLHPLPRADVALEGENVTKYGSKRARIEHALRHYQRGAVVHAEPLRQLEDQQLTWSPAADKDDLLDALAGALRSLFPGVVA